jgi:RNA polymerase sigma-70 factor (ECF subfamily)
MDDSVILDLYRARSESAISETAKKYGAYCLSIAKNILHSSRDSEECVNDTYLKTWESIPPQNPVKFSSFLGKITRNLSINRYNAQKTQKRGGGALNLVFEELEECLTGGGSAEEHFDANETARLIDTFLRGLERDNRVIFVRRYWHAESVKEIARRFDMSESSIKSILFRVRKRLKTELEKEGVSI